MTDLHDDIALAALEVAGHVREGGFEGVVVSGASHQLSRALLALAWGVLYPKTPLPRVYPLDDDANALLYKVTSPGEDPAEFREWMHTQAPELEASRGKKLIMVDDFAIQAYKYRGIRESLQRLGFSDVSFAFFAALENTELGADAFVGIRSEAVTTELLRMAQNIQDQPEPEQLLLHEFGARMERYRERTLRELRDIGQRMKR